MYNNMLYCICSKKEIHKKKEEVHKMKKFELAVKIIVDEQEKELTGYYQDWGIETWADMLEAYGQDSQDFKEDVIYMLNDYSNENNVNLYLNDSNELEDEEGNFISYRKIINAVRKEMKNRGLLA